LSEDRLKIICTLVP